MGRPKLSDLSCSICDVSFKKKSTFEEHMENHLASGKQNRQSRARSNWCHVCKKSFDDDDKYNLHMEKEHQFDSPKLKIQGSKDLFSCESGYVILSKKLLNKKRSSKEGEPVKKKPSVYENKSFDISLTDIKIEPNEKIIEDVNYIENKSPPRKNILKIKPPKIKCPLCGMKCKGERGLKIHMSAHKKNSRKNSIDASESEDEIDEDNQFDKSLIQDKRSSPGHCTNPSLLLSKNVVNVGQNTQPTYILSVPQLQNQSLNNIVSMGKSANNVLNSGNQVGNLLNISNQSNAPFTQVIPKQIVPSFDDIPKFDCNSQKYMKWLKKFVSNCKMQKYPLSPETYEKVSHISGEITMALFDPIGSLKQKSVHFYVLNMHNILSEIMMSHMEHFFDSIGQ